MRYAKIFLQEKGMKKIGLILLIVLVGGGFWFMTSLNTLPSLDENVKEKWAQVQNQYKRRTDLVPNLVATVKAYAAHEKETFLQVVEARNKATQVNLKTEDLSDPQKIARFEQAQGSMSSALSRLMVVVEKYPELKSNKNFLALQSQLEGTENRISVARRDFIQAVKKYNTELRTFPGRFIALQFYPDAKLRETFSVTEAEQAVPEVKF